MFSPQPIYLSKYLRLTKNRIPVNLKRLFYLSYEDALWDILKNKNIKEGSLILTPSFFCGDVEENIIKHGYKIAHYSIKNNLQVDIKNFEKQIKDLQPNVIIVFHIVGITSNLFKNLDWITSLKDNVIIIEDCVHKIVNPEEIKIYKKNHFIINSLRKVVPLQGSSVYGLRGDLNFSEPPFAQSIFYSLKVHLFWLLMNFSWKYNLHYFAEKLMIKGYNIIGDSKLPASGFWVFKFLEEFLNYEKIYNAKFKQATFYKKKLKDISPQIQKSDFGNLRGWPIILKKEGALNILEYIRSRGLLVRFELGDSPWSQDQKVIYLPMGLHINEVSQEKICQILMESWELGSDPHL